MKTYTSEEVALLGIIDQCEWRFWHLHEHDTDEAYLENIKRKDETVKRLKEEFGYTDADIREGWEDWYKEYPIEGDLFYKQLKEFLENTVK